jgi:hypothetical protein
MNFSYILLIALALFATVRAQREIGCSYYNGNDCTNRAGFVPATEVCTTFALNGVTKSWTIDCQNGQMEVKEYEAAQCSGGMYTYNLNNFKSLFLISLSLWQIHPKKF